MVFFTCNACGASLKKNQVEKHYQSECRNCEVLSCMDCGKDFYGDDYAKHIKCVSEAEKYQGALYKDSGKGGPAKGEKKQQEWLERVRNSVLSADVNPRISRLLEKISEYPNIPRKKSKFENFVRNSCQVRDNNTLSQLWEIFSRASQPTQQEATGSPEGETDAVLSADSITGDKLKRSKEDCEEMEGDSPVANGVDELQPEGDGHSKKRKKKHKENRELQQPVQEESEQLLEWYEDHTPDKGRFTEKREKSKHKSSETESCDPSSEMPAEVCTKKKRKHKHTHPNDTDVTTSPPKKMKADFAQEPAAKKRKKHKHKH